MVGCNREPEREWCDETISVVITNEASLRKIKDSFVFTPEFFYPLQLSDVEHLTTAHDEQVRRYMLYGEQPANQIILENVRMILRLNLSEPNKQTVITYENILNLRSDVYGATRNLITPFPTQLILGGFL